MKNYQIIILLTILSIHSCIAQTDIEKLFGTWIETNRDYVYYKTDMAYNFTKVEADVFKGSQIVFTKDTIFSYVTYLIENTIYPVSYEVQDLKTDISPSDEGNLSELLRKKGKSCKKIIVKKKYFNGYKEIYSKYEFYLFDDGTLALLRDYSLHYFNKTSSENIGKWDKNEIGQTIIPGVYSGYLSIENNLNKSFLQISYFPAKNGNNNCQIDYIDKSDNTSNNIFKQKDILNKEVVSLFFKNLESVKRFKLFVGSSKNPIDSQWEVRYKFVDKVGKIKTSKSKIFSSPETPSKMYLLLNNEVEITAEKNEWLKIRYYGKKTIEGWIKKEDVSSI